MGATFWKRNAFKALIETERLVLRPLSADDTQAFYDLNNDPEVIQYTGDLPFASANDAWSFYKITINLQNTKLVESLLSEKMTIPS